MALEQYLEEKALQGWMLDDIIGGLLIFKKKNPKKCKFSVDIFTDKNEDEYIEYCEAGGWNCLFKHNKYLIFYTEEKNITPIQTDEEIVLKKVRKSILGSLLYHVFLIGLMISNLFTGEKNGYGFFSEIADNGALLVMASLIIIIIGTVTDTIKDGLWYFKSNRAFKLNENINYPSLKLLKVKNVCFQVKKMVMVFFSDISNNAALLVMESLIIVIIGSTIDLIKDGLWYLKSNKAFKLNENISYPSLILLKIKNICFKMYMCILVLMSISLFGDLGSDRGYIFLAVFVVMGAICISRIISILLKKHKNSSKVVGIIICVVGMFVSTKIIVSGSAMVNDLENNSKTPIMNISNFIDAKTKQEYLYFDTSKSFLASSYTYSYEGYYNDTEVVDELGNEVHFDYEIYKSEYKWIIDKIFESYLKRYTYFEYKEVKDENWDALTVYKSDKSDDGYLLKYKDRVISVSGSIDFSNKNIEVIKEKCINW